jgi:Methyltransferase domain
MAWRGESRRPTPERVLRFLRTFAADPVVVARALPGEIRQRSRGKQYLEAAVDEAWEEHLHSLLGVAWPCPQARRLDEIMTDIDARLATDGLAAGRYTYAWYSDAEGSLSRAVWCVAMHTRPEVVVETGVAHGVTSRIVLEALQQNDLGHLWSVDLPFPFDKRLHTETGAAVTDECRPRWSYLEGSSRQRLPPLVTEVGRINMFIHDSLHTARNTIFEMEQVASVMPIGGVMLIDDIKSHKGFVAFCRRHPGYKTIACESADKIGMFGIAVKVASP